MPGSRLVRLPECSGGVKGVVQGSAVVNALRLVECLFSVWVRKVAEPSNLADKQTCLQEFHLTFAARVKCF
jgi:hypothetical protein